MTAVGVDTMHGSVLQALTSQVPAMDRNKFSEILFRNMINQFKF